MFDYVRLQTQYNIRKHFFQHFLTKQIHLLFANFSTEMTVFPLLSPIILKQMYEKADTFLTNSNKKASALTMNCLFWAKIGLITT